MARPRKFDEITVLNLAMDVFWRRGYEGASMSELSKAMGMNAPSIYATFGSKEGLFQRVLNCYEDRRRKYAEWTVAGSTAQDVAERMLYGAVDWLTDANEPLGCLLIQGGLAASATNGEIPKDLTTRQSQLEVLLATRFDLAVNDGDLPAETDARELARYLHVVFCGLAVQAARGASRKQLRSAAARALIGWSVAFDPSGNCPQMNVLADNERPCSSD